MNPRRIRHFLFILYTGMAIVTTGKAERKRHPAYEKYITQYSYIAVQQGERYNIPPSITLAQGLHESGAGLSRLSLESNNHFGIKCHKDWKGARTYWDDDLKDECFRKYNNVAESYEDHSRFLVDKKRYSKLFLLRKTDYRGWAKGLQECGYATDRAYANKLIKMIEDYELYLFDTGKKIAHEVKEKDKPKDKPKNEQTKTPADKSPKDKKPTQTTTPPQEKENKEGSFFERMFGKKKAEQPQQRPEEKNLKPRNIYKTGGLLYTIARYNDSFDRIAKDLGFTTRELARYNESPENFSLRQGDIVYLERKKKRADMPNLYHQVQIGESMHSISQYYGIQVNTLYTLNEKERGYVPREGETLKLR